MEHRRVLSATNLKQAVLARLEQSPMSTDRSLTAIKHPHENCAGQITTDEGGVMASQVFDDSDESSMSLQKFQRRVTMATCTIPYGYLSARPEDYFDRMSVSD